jgi:hypothetical protein
MKLRRGLWLLPAFHVCAAGADENGLHTLTVAAEVPAVTVTPQPPERHFFELPSLDYVFRVEARCHGDWQPESLSLNVADSRVTRSGAELLSNAEQQLKLEVPAKQLAPIAMRNFCVINAVQEGSSAAAETPIEPPARLPGSDQMTVNAALSVHASLRCSHGDARKTVYISQPLDLLLSCDLGDEEGRIAAH